MLQKAGFFWVLIILSLFSAGCLTKNVQIIQDKTGTWNLTAFEARNIIESNSSNSNYIILDVRTRNEFDSGHIAGSLSIDVSSDSFNDEILKLPMNKDYIIYCQSGRRSQKAVDKMKKMGYSKLYHIIGGIEAWKRAGFTLTER